MILRTPSILLSVALCLLLSPCLLAQGKLFKDFVEFKDLKHYQIAKIADVSGIFIEDSSLTSFVAGQKFYFKSRYKKSAPDSFGAFAYEHKSVDKEGNANYKFPFGRMVGAGDWIARANFGKHGYFLLGSDLRIAAYSAKEEAIAVKDIILDRLKPPADSRGEPTNKEIYSFRSRLKSAHSGFERKDMIVSGFIAKPKKLPDSDGSQFLVSSRIPGFTLLTMKCDPLDPSFCKIKRSCFLSGSQAVKPEDVSGISYSEKRNLLLIGDKKYNRLFAYRYHSCHHVRYLGVIHLPSKLKGLRSFTIDSEDSLWVATKDKDLYLNASVYVWPSASW